MAPLPKRKLSRQRGRERLAGQQKNKNILSSLTVCPKCSKKTLAHRACSYCGYYKNKKIV